MSIVVTGATGHRGRLTVQALLRGVVPAEQVVATGRRTETLDDLAAQGVTVLRADFEDPQSLREAFDGAEKVVLRSPGEVGQRRAAGELLVDTADLEKLLGRPATPLADAVAELRG